MDEADRRDDAGRRAALDGVARAELARGARCAISAASRRVVDGPFAESKELVGGFVIVELESRAEAIGWAQRYADVLGEVELDIRPVAGLSTFGK